MEHGTVAEAPAVAAYAYEEGAPAQVVHMPPYEHIDQRPIPEEVCEYLRYFKRCVREQNVHEIQNLYDFGFSDLTERYYREKLWPDEDRVRMVIPDDQDTNFFLILYKELYYRYLYGKIPRGPSLEHRWNSFQNYQALFSYILNPTEPVKLDLPNQWLWDIIDEFVYQFQSFCQYKSSVNKRTKEEIEDLKTMDEQLWNLYPVLNILYSLVSKSQINLQLRAALDREDVSDSLTEFGSHPLYYRLGYFSLIGLCRLHVLLGDYFQALKTIENLQFNAKEIYNTVPTCSVALHYYVGFCHMMARRYQETVQLFVACLMFIQRTRGIQYQQQQKTWQYDITSKTADQMYNLLAICLILQPQRIDESVQSQLNEKFSEKMNRMARGQAIRSVSSLFVNQNQFNRINRPDGTNFIDGAKYFLTSYKIPLSLEDYYWATNNLRNIHYCKVYFLKELPDFESAFQMGCPKFLLPAVPSYDVTTNFSKEPTGLQCRVFMEEVKQQITIPILRGYLKLYTTLHVSKLSSFVEIKEEDLISGLLSFKHKMYDAGKADSAGSEDDSTTDLDFYIDKDMINVADTKVARRYGEYFVKHIQKLMELNKTLSRINVGGRKEKVGGQKK